MFFTAAGLRHPAGDSTTKQLPAAKLLKPCVSEPPTWKSGMPNSRLLPGLRLEQQIAGPGLIDLIAVGVAHKLRRAGGAAGVKVSRGLAHRKSRLPLTSLSDGCSLMRSLKE